MKTRLLIIVGISIVLVAFFTANSFMNLYHYGEYLKIDDGNILHCSSDGQKQFCDNTSIRVMELFGFLPDREHHPDQLEEIEGYAIDYGGEVKHLPFVDVCTNEMKIILLKHSNISSPEEEFVLEDVGLPFGMNQEDFKRCTDETSFTKSRWNMVDRENPEKEIMKKARDLGINNIMKAVDSEDLSYDEKKEYIKIRYEESPNKIPALNIRIKDFDRNLEFGERPTFTVIETGYASTCTSPKLEVYYLKSETGYDLKTDEPIYENQIVYTCYDPASSYFPILKFWNDADFKPFPACDKAGRYLVVGDSGYERMALEEYYCEMENED